MLLMMLALCFGCRPQFPAAPRDGGPPWTELTSKHFTVWTDADPARVLELIRQIERFHHVASAIAYPTAPSSGRALVIVLEDWIANGHHLELQFQIAMKDVPITARRLGDADAYAVRALILGGPTPAQGERARQEIEHALDVEPTNPLAWVFKTRGGGGINLQIAQTITAAHPEDWRAWWLATTSLENANGDPAEIDRARTRACALIAQNRALVAPPRLCPHRDGTPPSR
jgi:hypothetical protein